MTTACQAVQVSSSPPAWTSWAGRGASGSTRWPPKRRRSRPASPQKTNAGAGSRCGNSRSPKLWRSKAPNRTGGGCAFITVMIFSHGDGFGTTFSTMKPAHPSFFVLIALIGGLAILSSTLSKTPVLPLFAHALHASPAEIGWIVVASTLPGILISYPAGALSDHLGARRVLLAS